MIKKRNRDNIRLLFTDNDCVIYVACSDDFDHDLWATRVDFDLASYPRTSPFYDGMKNKMVGNVKDEAKGCCIISLSG